MIEYLSLNILTMMYYYFYSSKASKKFGPPLICTKLNHKYRIKLGKMNYVSVIFLGWC